jgi:hypothetical protein
MTEPMDVDTLERAIEYVRLYRAADRIEFRLRQNREAIQKVRDDLAITIAFAGPGHVLADVFKSWLAALDEVLKEGT